MTPTFVPPSTTTAFGRPRGARHAMAEDGVDALELSALEPGGPTTDQNDRAVSHAQLGPRQQRPLVVAGLL
jgi:hypothetical protein